MTRLYVQIATPVAQMAALGPIIAILAQLMVVCFVKIPTYVRVALNKDHCRIINAHALPDTTTTSLAIAARNAMIDAQSASVAVRRNAQSAKELPTCTHIQLSVRYIALVGTSQLVTDVRRSWIQQNVQSLIAMMVLLAHFLMVRQKEMTSTTQQCTTDEANGWIRVLFRRHWF